MFTKIISVQSQNYTKSTNTFCGQSAEFINVGLLSDCRTYMQKSLCFKWVHPQSGESEAEMWPLQPSQK